jgi:uncharacterized Ntn-hydrolase superfamily protein
MTFSIVARCPSTKMFGVVNSSSSPAVAARCGYARAGVGAVASQNLTDPRLGVRGLEFLSLGASAAETVAILERDNPHIAYRQILAIGATSEPAAYSGSNALGIWAHAIGNHAAAGGNMLKSANVPSAVVEAFEVSSGDFGDRLLAAMRAGLDAGGEAGPIHSAGMKLVRDVSWPVADLRVDWTDKDPIGELTELWTLYKPQLEDYVTRALRPADAPTFGVPGDP